MALISFPQICLPIQPHSPHTQYTITHYFPRQNKKQPNQRHSSAFKGHAFEEKTIADLSYECFDPCEDICDIEADLNF